MALDPQFATTPRLFRAVTTAANTSRDLSSATNAADLVPAGRTYDTRIDRILIAAIGTTTAGNIRLYVHDGTNYTRWRAEIAVPARATVDADDLPWSTEIYDAIDPSRPLIDLPKTWKITVASHIAETFQFLALGADYTP